MAEYWKHENTVNVNKYSKSPPSIRKMRNESGDGTVEKIKYKIHPNRGSSYRRELCGRRSLMGSTKAI